VNKAISHLDKEMGSLDSCRAKLAADLQDKVRLINEMATASAADMPLL
jgi:hypothetical protein